MSEESLALSSRARQAAREIVALPTARKNEVLLSVADLLEEEKAFLQQENQRDLAAAREKGMGAAMLNRLELSDAVLLSMIAGVRELVALQDPVGEIEEMSRRPNGLLVGRMRVPLGVILMIYESRPNVTVDAAVLCLKAGNAGILKGGSEAIHSNRALAKILQTALTRNQLNPDLIQVITTGGRAILDQLLEKEEDIDLVIPRGGEGLIRHVMARSRIPVLKHYKGVCHIYVDKDADLEKALSIILNAKTQRPGVCNALEGLLIHREIAVEFVPKVAEKLIAAGVEIRGCAASCALTEGLVPATATDWGQEFLALILCLRVVDDYEEARAYIGRYGSHHTESIITENYSVAQRFLAEIDASAVVVNASTRFNDGGELGLGAEIGICTTKLHSYGPMGLKELTARKFVILGSGQIRG